MKLTYSYEQTPEETQSQEETIKTVVDKILSFGDKVFNAIVANKAASRSNIQYEQLDRLARTVEILNSKIDRLEASQKHNSYCKK